MQRYAREQAPAVADLTRLFGTVPGFESSIRPLLELRLAQVDGPNVDRDLRESVSNAVRDIKPHPSSALTWIRRILRSCVGPHLGSRAAARQDASRRLDRRVAACRNKEPPGG